MITGDILLGGQRRAGGRRTFRAIDPAILQAAALCGGPFLRFSSLFPNNFP